MLCILRRLGLTKNRCNNMNNSRAGIARLCFFLLTMLRCISVILANNQLDRGMFLSAINTRSPTTKLRLCMFHFLRVVMMGKYSRIHLCQNDCSATWTVFHFCLFTMSRGFSTGHINKFGLAVPVRKWFGVNASKSLMSSLRGLRVDHLWWIQFQSNMCAMFLR